MLVGAHFAGKSRCCHECKSWHTLCFYTASGELSAGSQQPASPDTVAMFVSKQVIEKLEGEQTRLRRDVKYLRNAAERGDNKAVRVHAEDLASRLENHASLVDAVIEAVSEDAVSEVALGESLDTRFR